MNRDEIFQIWAPPAAVWSPWVKPVLFSRIHDEDTADIAHLSSAKGLISPGPDTAVVIDVPGAAGVSVGMRLAEAGLRPIPLYNSCPAPDGVAATIDARPILTALAAAAPSLAQAHLADDARPAFLLDADRRIGTVPPAAGIFDNRYVSLPTDFPSANLLLSRGIRRVLLILADGAEVQADLAHTLRRWQEVSIEILLRDTPPHPIEIRRPSRFRWIFHNALAIFGLRRNPLGGFSGMLPFPSAG